MKEGVVDTYIQTRYGKNTYHRGLQVLTSQLALLLLDLQTLHLYGSNSFQWYTLVKHMQYPQVKK